MLKWVVVKLDSNDVVGFICLFVFCLQLALVTVFSGLLLYTLKNSFDVQFVTYKFLNE